jgi:glyoxylase-like metal-dependent hydrolase (beta-lactamase superfamily II)
VKEIARGVFRLPVSITNVYFVGERSGPWVLVDTGIAGRAWQIRQAAESLYGWDTRPEAILLTHGHADHSGSALDLAQLWDVEIFAHRLEMPYITGKSAYPPLDPTVGGFLAMLGRFVSPAVLNLGDSVRPLESGWESFGLDDWEVHHTPGHSPGHVAFFRPSDGTLLAGDALTTVNLDSLVETAARFPRVGRPPAPSTSDWIKAEESVKLLAELRPLTIACGHGIPMTGGKAVMQLAELATHFPAPLQGRYVREPVVADENGVVTLPPAPPDFLPGVALGLGIAAAAGTMFALAAHRRRRKHSTTAGTPAPAS